MTSSVLEDALRTGTPATGQGSFEPLDGDDLTDALYTHNIHRRGVSLSNLHFRGTFVLVNTTLSGPLYFDRCIFDRIVILSCQLPQFAFENCSVLHTSIITGTTFQAGFISSDTVFYHGLQLSSSHIGNAFAVTGCSLSPDPQGFSLLADNLTVHGKSVITAAAAGTTSLRGATFRGDLTINGAYSGLHPTAIDAEALHCSGHIELSSEMSTKGGVRLVRLSCSSLTVSGVYHNPSGQALNMSGARIEGNLIHHGVRANGETRLLDATVRGQLLLLSCEYKNPYGVGFGLQSTSVRGLAKLEGVVITGEYNMSGAYLEDQLELDDTTLNGRLNLDRIRVQGNVAMQHSNIADGVLAAGACIGGQLRLQRGRIEGAWPALSATATNVGESLVMGPDLLVLGGLGLDDSHIGRDVRIRRSGVSGQADEYARGRPAIAATRLSVGGSVDMHYLATRGTVGLAAATIHGHFTASGAAFQAERSLSLVLDDARIDTLDLEGLTSHEGISLRNTNIRGLVDTPSVWEDSEYYLRGMKLGSLDGPDADDAGSWSRNCRVAWALRAQDRSIGLLREIAAVYAAVGRARDATAVMVRGSGGLAEGAEKALMVVGYGYRAWYAVFILAALMVPTLLVVSYGDSMGAVVPSGAASSAVDCAEYPCLNEVVFTLESVIPLLDLGQTDAWHIDTERAPAVGAWLWGVTLVGWLLASVFVASVTGIIRGIQRPPQR